MLLWQTTTWSSAKGPRRGVGFSVTYTCSPGEATAQPCSTLDAAVQGYTRLSRRGAAWSGAPVAWARPCSAPASVSGGRADCVCFAARTHARTHTRTARPTRASVHVAKQRREERKGPRPRTSPHHPHYPHPLAMPLCCQFSCSSITRLLASEASAAVKVATRPK